MPAGAQGSLSSLSNTPCSRGSALGSIPAVPVTAHHQHCSSPACCPGMPCLGRAPSDSSTAQSVEFSLATCSSSHELAVQDRPGWAAVPWQDRRTPDRAVQPGHAAFAITCQDNFHTLPPLIPCLLTLFLPLAALTAWLKAKPAPSPPTAPGGSGCGQGVRRAPDVRT